MPARPQRPCTHPGCVTLTTSGKCDAHRQIKRREQEALRGTAAERGYDSDWRRLRAAYLKANPLCQCDDCRGGELQATLATVVNHRIDIAERPDLRLTWSNLQSMSKTCHDKHTARTRGWGKARASDTQGGKSPWSASPAKTVCETTFTRPRNGVD